MACYNTYNREGSRTAERIRESELDLFLNEHYNDVVKDLKFGNDVAKIFDLNPQDLTINKINKIKKITTSIKEVLSDDGEFEKLHDHPDYMGITEFISDPISGISKKFDVDKEKQKLIDKFKLTHSESEADKLADATINSWKMSGKFGDDVHDIMQAVFSNTDIPKMRYLTDEQINSVKQLAENFKHELQDKYGINSEFYSEISIPAKEIDPDIKVALEGRGKKNISGTIDLLVVAEDGTTHIYDFKTSKSSMGSSWTSEDGWHPEKKKRYENQVVGYSAMLEQYDIANSTLHIVPFLLDFSYTDDTKTQINGLNSVKMEQVADIVPSGNTYNKWKTFLPLQFEFNSDSLISVDGKIQHMLPVKTVRSIKVQRDTKEVQYYIEQCRPVQPSSPYYGKMKWSFLKKGVGKDEIVFFKDDSERDQEIEKFVAKLKDVRANELDTIAVNIKRAINKEITLSDIANSFSDDKQAFIAHQFQRYIDGGWQFIRNKEMNAYGIFIFKKDGRSEVIVISNQSLGTVFKLAHGTTILGKTREDQYVDSKKILNATTGNMELMRAMTYIAENQNLFKDAKISQVKVINPWHGRQTTALNSKLIENYNLLVQDNASTYDGDLKYLNNSIFWGDVVSTLSIADDLLKLESETGLRGFTMDGQEDVDGKTTQFTIEWIQERMKFLKRKYGYLYNVEETKIGDPNIWAAYKQLNDALLALTNRSVVQEFDRGLWLANGVVPGVQIASTSYSPSANIRIFDDLMAQFATEVRIQSEKKWRPIVSSLKAFYKSKGRPSIIGGEAEFFREWFVTDPTTGKIADSFSLMDPEDRAFTGSPESKAALDIWLKTMAQLRWPNATDEEIQAKKDNGEYYRVPLTEARFSRQAKNLGTFGVAKALINKFQQYGELTRDVFAGESQQKEDWIEETIDNNLSRGLYNKFFLTEEQREGKIREKGVGFFETDLEEVMRQALTAYTKSDVSKKYIPAISAMQISMRLGQSFGDQKQKDTEKALNALIKSKFYGETVISKDLQPLARWVSVLKKGLSTLSLGFNMRSFIREFLQGTWMGISRSGLNNLPGVSEKTYLAAYEHVLTNAYKNFSSVSKLQQLDAHFGVANHSLNNISRKRRINWFGIGNVSSDTLFWGSTAPDFQHRMTILVAKMMGDGVWDAYTLDENGDLKYEWKKDKRFSVYASGDINNKDYLAQKTLYEKHIEELNNIGFKYVDANGIQREYKVGDDLPEAYLPKEIQAIKNYSDLLYGHYDDESRSLINDMFLGSLFMQYKTYIVSRVEQWTLNPGTYNTEFLEWDTDPISGQKLYKIHKKELVNGKPEIEIKAEGDISNMEELKSEGLIEPLYVWKGMPMEGIARSYLKFFKDIKSWDWETIKEKWKDPIERDNILLGMHDCILASLMIMIITGLFGLAFKGEWITDTKKVARAARDSGWGGSFAFNVLSGSFQDFPIWSTLNSILGDWNPPAWTAGKRVIENTGAVIFGDKSVFQALTNTVGAAADLKGLANRLAET